MSLEKVEVMDFYNCKICIGEGFFINLVVGILVFVLLEFENIDVGGIMFFVISFSLLSLLSCLVDVESMDVVY